MRASSVTVPMSVNQSELGMSLDTKYQNVGVGVGLDGRTSHIDMDMLYTDVIVVRLCIENYHVHPGTGQIP